MAISSQKHRKSFQLLEKSFKTLKNSNIEELVKFYHDVSKEKLFLHKKKKNSVVVDIVKLFKEIADDELELIWKNLKEQTHEAIKQFIDLQKNHDSVEAISKLLDFFDLMCVFTFACIELEKVPEEFVMVVIFLHGCLLDFENHSFYLASNVCVVCFEFYTRQINCNVDVCSHVLIFFLSLLLQKNFATKQQPFSLVVISKYIVSMKDVLPVLLKEKQSLNSNEFDDPALLQQLHSSSDSISYNLGHETKQELHEIITALFTQTSVVSNTNCRKFLAAAFTTTSITLMEKIHLNVAHHLTMHNPPLNFEIVGSLYQQAWFACTDESMKKHFEDFAIQDLMYKAVRTPRGKSYGCKSPFQEARTFLQSLFRHKTSMQLKHMGARLYEPFIWRAMQAANSIVRANAITLLVDKFPLRLDSNTHVQQENYIVKQVKHIGDALEDPCPQVRIVALYGTFEIFNLYWNILESCNITKIFQNIYGKLSFDVASEEIREAVLIGTKFLLTNGSSHMILSKLLPNLKAMINDSSEKVRTAYADMLLAVQKTDTIMFYDVCAIDIIFKQIEKDKPTVCKRLNQLLIPSYFPQDQPSHVWVKRCIHFLSKTPTGARKFYFDSAKVHDLKDIGKIIQNIVRFVFHNVRKLVDSDKQDSDSIENDDSTNSKMMRMTFNESNSSASIKETNKKSSNNKDFVMDPDIIADLLEIVAILWSPWLNRLKVETYENEETVENSQNRNKEILKLMKEELSKTIRICFRELLTDRTHDVLIELASVLDPSIIKSFSRTLIPKLRSLPISASKCKYSMLIRCACRWKWTNQVLELALDWIEHSYKESQVDDGKLNNSTKKGKKKKVAFKSIPNESRPDQALKYLNTFLNEMDTTSIKVKASFENLMKLSKTLNHTLTECVNIVCGNSKNRHLPSWTEDMLLDGINLQLKLLSDCYFHSIKSKKRTSMSSGDAYNMTKCKAVMESLRNIVEVISNDIITTKNHFNMTMNMSVLDSNQNSGSNFLQRTTISNKCTEILLKNLICMLKARVPVVEITLRVLKKIISSKSQTDKHMRLLVCLFNELVKHHVLYEWTMSVQNELETTPINISILDSTPLENQNIGVPVNSDIMIQIYEQIVVSLMASARTSPDSFISLMKIDVKKKLKSTMKLLYDLESHHKLVERFFSKICNFSVKMLIQNLENHSKDNSTTSNESYENTFKEIASVDDLPQFSSVFLPILCSTQQEINRVLSCRSFTISANKSETVQIKVFKTFLASSLKPTKKTAEKSSKSCKQSKRVLQEDADTTTILL